MIFSHAQYDVLLRDTIAEMGKLSTLKGGEYAGDQDRLANFRRNAKALGMEMEQVWAVYCAKHWDAIMQYIRDLGEGKTRPRMESITGRADDIIVYLTLFKAMVYERDNVPIVGGSHPGIPDTPVFPAACVTAEAPQNKTIVDDE
jgi:hypothetical protein